MYATVLTTCLDWLSVSNTSCAYFLPWVSFFKKKKNVWDVFPITILTSAWLHMNSLTQSLSRETTVALLSIAMSPTKKTYGLFHSCPLQTIWGCEGMQQKASFFMVGWQVYALTTGSAVSNQCFPKPHYILWEGNLVCWINKFLISDWIKFVWPTSMMGFPT